MSSMFSILISTALVLGSTFLIQGCEQRVSFAADIDKVANNTNPPSAVPACIIDIPQIRLQGNVDAFDFKSSGGFMFGFDKGGSFQGGGASISFTLSKAEFILSLAATDPLNPGEWLAYSMLTTDQSTVDISGEVDFSGAYINGHWTLPEPLEKVTAAGLTGGLKQLDASYNQHTAGLTNAGPQNWMGRVIGFNDSTHVLLNASTLAGIKEGDTFSVYNVQHTWQVPDAPCNSAHVSETRTTDAPIATIIAHPNTETVSIGEVIWNDGVNQINLGAQVIIKQLVTSGGANRVLKKKAIYDGITSQSFSVEDKNGNYVAYPFQDVLNDQARDFLVNPGNEFWIP